MSDTIKTIVCLTCGAEIKNFRDVVARLEAELSRLVTWQHHVTAVRQLSWRAWNQALQSRIDCQEASSHLTGCHSPGHMVPDGFCSGPETISDGRQASVLDANPEGPWSIGGHLTPIHRLFYMECPTFSLTLNSTSFRCWSELRSSAGEDSLHYQSIIILGQRQTLYPSSSDVELTPAFLWTKTISWA